MRDHGVSLFEFEMLMSDWDVSAMTPGGQFVGVVMRRHSEVHMQIDKQLATRYARRIIRQYLDPQLQEYGFLTSIALIDSNDIQFLERLGFYETSRTEQAILFRLDQLKIR